MGIGSAPVQSHAVLPSRAAPSSTSSLLTGLLLSALCAAAPAATAPTAPAPADHPWTNPALSPDERTHLLLNAMTQEEKLALVFGYFSSDAPWKHYQQPKDGLPQSAGYVPGVPRLGIPALYESDAGIGVASQPGDHPTPATALPANIAVAASWDPDVAYAGGQMIGSEARSKGFNVQLAGGINLAREPRNGRTFEYGGEDPLLAASIVAAAIRGVQSNHMISTIKHYAFNDQETNRETLDVRIDEPAGRMSDLLAFELAIEQSQPGSVMCSYNRINGAHSCENHWLLTDVLKSGWGFKGFVMSDWGGTHSTIPAANAGLDQDSGYPFDASSYFGDALKEAVANGHVPQARLDDMAGRVVWAMFNNGLFDHPVTPGDIDFAAHGAVTRAAEESGIVLLKNAQHVLPLKKTVKSIAIIGSHADSGVLSGGGSSQVYPPDGVAVLEKVVKHGLGPLVYFHSSPVEALATRTSAKLTFDPGTDIAAAVKLAARNELVIVFAHEWRSEGMDTTLQLDEDQDTLITALAKANHHIVVVLETGGPVLMPWINQVDGVLETWFPGSKGGEAIARVLTGEVNPSGHLPLTFPQAIDQLPRPALDGYPERRNARITVDYNIEGAAVGYRWFDRQHLAPLFPFGYGLSYSSFTYSGLKAEANDGQVSVHFQVKNTGSTGGKALAQVYVAPVQSDVAQAWQSPKRLGGFRKVTLEPGKATDVSLSIEPRLLAAYDAAQKNWSIAAGDYKVILATDANTPVATVTVHLPARHF